MSRLLASTLLVVSAVAWADVGPRPAPCSVPPACVTCDVPLGDPDAGAACLAGVADAGLRLQDCSDRAGSIERRHFCPPGTAVNRGGCSAAGFELSAVALLAGLVRRRRVSR